VLTRDGAAPGRVTEVVHSFRRGSYYPFVPDGDERDSRTAFKLSSVMDGELDVEGDQSFWYPLWPDQPGGHPWE